MTIKEKIKILIHYIGTYYLRVTCAKEYKKQKYTGYNERPVEFAFLFQKISEYWPRTILDVGTGKTALPHLMRNCGFLVTAVDNVKDYWPVGMVNHHYHVIDDDITHSKISGSFDVITCISVLEHIEEHKKAMLSMYRLLNPGGHLILTCPFSERQYVPDVYKLLESSAGVMPFSTQSFSRKEVDGWLADSPFELVEQEYWKFFDGDFWTCGSRLEKPLKVSKESCHQLSCMVLMRPAE